LLDPGKTGMIWPHCSRCSRTGQTVNTTGQTWGVYLFKANDEPPRTDQPWLVWAEAEGAL